MKIIRLLMGFFLVAFNRVGAVGQDTYILSEGEEAHERLNLQNTSVRGILNDAFQKISTFRHIDGAKVVDFGCGTSSAYPDIKKLIGPSGKYAGIDSSQKQIAFNKTCHMDVDYVVGDEMTPASRDLLSDADIIFIRFVVMHQKNPKEFLKKIYSVAKPGAFLIFQEPESDQETKNINTRKYPFMADLLGYKLRVGEQLGLDYNFAPQIKPYLESFEPERLFHETSPLELPLTQAKALLQKGINEAHAKNPAVLDADLLNRYTKVIAQLPDNDNEIMKLELMHTIIVQKK